MLCTPLANFVKLIGHVMDVYYGTVHNLSFISRWRPPPFWICGATFRTTYNENLVVFIHTQNWLFLGKIGENGNSLHCYPSRNDIGPRVLLLVVKKLNANRMLWTYFPTLVDLFFLHAVNGFPSGRYFHEPFFVALFSDYDLIGLECRSINRPKLQNVSRSYPVDATWRIHLNDQTTSGPGPGSHPATFKIWKIWNRPIHLVGNMHGSCSAFIDPEVKRSRLGLHVQSGPKKWYRHWVTSVMQWKTLAVCQWSQTRWDERSNVAHCKKKSAKIFLSWATQVGNNRRMEKYWTALYWQKHKRVAPTLTRSRSQSQARGTHWTCFMISIVSTWWITERSHLN